MNTLYNRYFFDNVNEQRYRHLNFDDALITKWLCSLLTLDEKYYCRLFNTLLKDMETNTSIEEKAKSKERVKIDFYIFQWLCLTRQRLIDRLDLHFKIVYFKVKRILL